jgi:hypothetical protein
MMTLKAISRQSPFYYVQWQVSHYRKNKKGRAMADSALVSVIYQSISWSYTSSYSPGAMPQLRPMTLADLLKK